MGRWRTPESTLLLLGLAVALPVAFCEFNTANWAFETDAPDPADTTPAGEV